MTGNSMRRRLTDGGDAARHEVDLKLSGRKEGEETPRVSAYKQKAQDEALGRQIRQYLESCPRGGEIGVWWNEKTARCRVEGRGRAGQERWGELAYPLLSSTLAHALDPLEVRG